MRGRTSRLSVRLRGDRLDVWSVNGRETFTALENAAFTHLTCCVQGLHFWEDRVGSIAPVDQVSRSASSRRFLSRSDGVSSRPQALCDVHSAGVLPDEVRKSLCSECSVCVFHFGFEV